MVPQVGMLLMIRRLWRMHPALLTQPADRGEISTHLDIEDRVYMINRSRGVLVCNGSWFAVDERQPCEYIRLRLTFAAAPENSIAEGIVVLARPFPNEFHL